MSFYKKITLLGVSFLCLDTPEINTSSYVSKICFYATPCYALSCSFDLMQNHPEDAIWFAQQINFFSSKMPKVLRCKMFKESLLKPSNMYENQFYGCRFESFYDELSLGGGLWYLSADHHPETEFKAALETVEQFYRYLIDSLNSRFIGTATELETDFQERITNSFVDAHKWITMRLEDNIERKARLEKIKTLIERLQKHAIESFAK